MATPSPSTATAYNDGNIQYGSIIVTVYGPPQPNGVSRGTYIVENIPFQRPTKVIERPDEIGGPNGFIVVNAQNTASATIQMGDNTTNRPQVGDWFTYTADAIIGAERWVLTEVTDPREMQGYFKANVTLRKASFPTVTPTFTPA